MTMAADMDDMDDMAAYALRHATAGGQTAVPRFRVLTSDRCSEAVPVLNQPVIALVLQGSKRVLIGDTVLTYGRGEFLAIGAELPATSQIVDASPRRPYVSLYFYIDPAVVSSVLLDMQGSPMPPALSAFAVSTADGPMLRAWARMLDLLDRPEEIQVLAPLIEHEIMFRMLRSPHGPLLRQLASADSHLSRLRQAMAWVRDRYSEPIRISDMAAVAGMSESAFHRRFKAATALSPLQYQKQIRLHEARRQMLAASGNATRVAFAVGYESASQFSREYKRLFGKSPRADLRRLQARMEHETVEI